MLTDERWEHVLREHPEMAELEHEVLDIVNSPDEIQRGIEEPVIALGKRDRMYLMVIYGETSNTDGFVVTAHFVRRRPKGDVVWARP